MPAPRQLRAVPVEALHRESVGELTLPPDLKPGEWRWLSMVDLKKLGYLS